MAHTLEENIKYIIKHANLTGTYVSEADGHIVVQYEYNGYSEHVAHYTFELAIDRLSEIIELDQTRRSA